MPYGTTITYESNTITIGSYGTITATPSTATAQYTYAFDKWTNQPTSVTGNIAFEANFTREGKIVEVNLVISDEINNTHNLKNNKIELVLWEKFGVGYYSNASCDESSRLVKVDVPTKTDFDFNGYYTEREGQGIQFADEAGNLETTYTLFEDGVENYVYAYWTPVEKPDPPIPPQPEQPENINAQTGDSIVLFEILALVIITIICLTYATIYSNYNRKDGKENKSK